MGELTFKPGAVKIRFATDYDLHGEICNEAPFAVCPDFFYPHYFIVVHLPTGKSITTMGFRTRAAAIELINDLRGEAVDWENFDGRDAVFSDELVEKYPRLRVKKVG